MAPEDGESGRSQIFDHIGDFADSVSEPKPPEGGGTPLVLFIPEFLLEPAVADTPELPTSSLEAVDSTAAPAPAAKRARTPRKPKGPCVT